MQQPVHLDIIKGISRALASAGLFNTAWRGENGGNFYRHTSNYRKSLARLAGLAENDGDLLYLAAGWYRAHCTAPKVNIIDKDLPLAVVLEDLQPHSIAVLETLHKQRLELIVILLDMERRYVGNSKQILRKGLSWVGTYLQGRGLLCPEPIEIGSLDKFGRSLVKLQELEGVRLIHLLGPATVESQERPASAAPRFPSMSNIPAVPNQKRPLGDYSVESLALSRIARDLQALPQVTCLWARSAPPGPLTVLRRRFQYCSTEGLMMQAVGLAASQIHPLVAISAAGLPQLLPDLLEMASFPITFLIMESGLSTTQPEMPPLPAQIHDLSMLRNVNGLTVAVPSDEEEARSMLRTLLTLPYPGALRLTGAPAVGVRKLPEDFIIEPGRGRRLREGDSIAFLCLGSAVHHAMLAANTLHSWGFEAAVYDMRYLQPLDKTIIAQAAQIGKIIVAEEHVTQGGLNSAVLEALALYRWENPLSVAPIRTRAVGLNPQIASCIPDDHGLSMDGLLLEARQLLGINSPL